MSSEIEINSLFGNEKSVDDLIKIFKEENDPQTVFNLIPISPDKPLQQETEDAREAILKSQYFWATRIERTVQEKLGSSNARERFSMERSWERASFRAKLVDFLPRQTPWLFVIRDESGSPGVEQLHGDYHSDKIIYQKITHEFLSSSLPAAQKGKLQIIERYISETLVSIHDKMIKPLRFSVSLPLTTQEGPPRILILTLTFAQKKDGTKTSLEVSTSLYEAGVNTKALEEQRLNEKLLGQGRSILDNWTLYILD
ncbi:uncharacterized protein RCO7_11522 [Rhynchosporium graminicola]|uniref:Uncharacterized protein n=1 Tax=Rhynchosporium graminicola TaxID=2792576 RepID=A0A1E1L0W1_9HELO|nr:uncharacterized protein RCO7_11522 [Rhynchosporium commune]